MDEGESVVRSLVRSLSLDADRGGTDRIEAFSDAIMAIAITLLILEVHVTPEHGESLADALARQWATIIAFIAAFGQIGVIWVNHHALFRVVRRVDQATLLLNLFLLLGVTFMPLPFRLVTSYLMEADAERARTAALLYGVTLAAHALAFNLLWRHVRKAGLLDDAVPSKFKRDVTTRYLIGLCAYSSTSLIAFWSPIASVLVTVALGLVFAFGPSPRSESPKRSMSTGT